MYESARDEQTGRTDDTCLTTAPAPVIRTVRVTVVAFARRVQGAVALDRSAVPATLTTEGPVPNGIQYVTDNKGRKVAVQLDLRRHGGLWEDIADVLVSRSRRHETRLPLATVKARLVRRGKLPRG